MELVENSSSISGDSTNNVVYYHATETQYVAYKSEGDMFFAGQTSDRMLQDILSGVIPTRIRQMVINAINNRTRERNMARLSEQLAAHEISEDEYDAELLEHEDSYTIKCDVMPTLFEVKAALSLVPDILDVNDIDDLSVLFSFDEGGIRKLL